MSFRKLVFFSLILYSVVIINGNSELSFINTLNKLIQNNERRLRVIKNLYSPKHSALSYRSFYKNLLSRRDGKKDKPVLVVVVLNQTVPNDLKISDFPMKTGKHMILSPTSSSEQSLEATPGKIITLIKHLKRKDRVKRNVNLVEDNTKPDDMFNREKPDGTLRSLKIKDHDLTYTRRNMLTSCDRRSLLLCVKAWYKANKQVCKSYECSPKFIRLAVEECAAMCEKEHVNGMKYSDSDDDYVALDTDNYYDDDD